MSQTTKRKIAVLGGGPSALASVFALTKQEDWNQHYDITVYQMGWRLGGKCATGRGIHDRIEDHGIHFFLGWYDNAFQTVHEVFAERTKRKLYSEDCPIKKWEDALLKENCSIIPDYNRAKGRWEPWPLYFPPNALVPGGEEEISMFDNFKKMTGILLQMVIGSPFEATNPFVDLVRKSVFAAYVPDSLYNIIFTNSGTTESGLNKWLDKHFDSKFFGNLETLKSFVTGLNTWGGKFDQVLATFENKPEYKSLFFSFMDMAIKWSRSRITEKAMSMDRVRRALGMTDLFWAIMKGVLQEVLEIGPSEENPKELSYVLNFEKINNMDFRAWLKKYGASELGYDSPMVRFFYDGTFAYPEGETEGPGNFAAGTALKGFLLTIFGYKGSFAWSFSAGVGDSLIAPMYEVLKDRGVKFKFFHKVEKLHVDGDEIKEITIGKQVRLLDEGKEYNPFIKIKGLNSWPNRPVYSQLNKEDALKLIESNYEQMPTLYVPFVSSKKRIELEKFIDDEICNPVLESPWLNWENVETLRLKKGVDFDTIILGIPPEALKPITTELEAANPKWATMLANLQTVATHNAQVWLKTSMDEMGMKWDTWGIPPNTRPNALNYENPLSTMADNSQQIPFENWPKDNLPKSLVYICGPLRDPDRDFEMPNPEFYYYHQERALTITEEWLRANAGFFWPDATSPGNPYGMYLGNLVDPIDKDNPHLHLRLRRQMVVAGINPSDRYTIAPPYDKQYRLKTDASGFKNLFITGDWIDNGYNFGCVESSVNAGILCAAAVQKHFSMKATIQLKKEVGLKWQ